MSEATTGHERIREPAHGKGGRPASMERAHPEDEVGLIRIMVPDNPGSHHENPVEIGRDEFFAEFEEKGLVAILDSKATLSKLVKR